MKNRDADIALAKARHAAGDSVEEQCARMRAAGLEKLDCIVVLCEALSLPLREAQRVVHQSATWGDRRESDERAQDLLCDVLESLPPVITVGELDEHFRKMERDST